MGLLLEEHTGKIRDTDSGGAEKFYSKKADLKVRLYDRCVSRAARGGLDSYRLDAVDVARGIALPKTSIVPR
jgi:hypothetical protein